MLRETQLKNPRFYKTKYAEPLLQFFVLLVAHQFWFEDLLEVLESDGVLSFCVVSLVTLQNRSFEEHATTFTILQNALRGLQI